MVKVNREVFRGPNEKGSLHRTRGDSGIGKRPDIAIAEKRSSFGHAAWVSSTYARYAAITRGELALARYLLELSDAA